MTIVSELLKATDGQFPAQACLISIRPEFVQKIYSANKRFEFRKRSPKHGGLFLIYETSPVQRVTGCFFSSKTIAMEPKALWDCCSEFSGIERERFFDYFKGVSKGCGIVIDRAMRFSEPYQLSALGQDVSVPQSFSYVSLRG